MEEHLSSSPSSGGKRMNVLGPLGLTLFMLIVSPSVTSGQHNYLGSDHACGVVDPSKKPPSKGSNVLFTPKSLCGVPDTVGIPAVFQSGFLPPAFIDSLQTILGRVFQNVEPNGNPLYIDIIPVYMPPEIHDIVTNTGSTFAFQALVQSARNSSPKPNGILDNDWSVFRGWVASQSVLSDYYCAVFVAQVDATPMGLSNVSSANEIPYTRAATVVAIRPPSIVNGQVTPDAMKTVVAVAAHEIGHSLGLDHGGYYKVPAFWGAPNGNMFAVDVKSLMHPGFDGTGVHGLSQDGFGYPYAGGASLYQMYGDQLMPFGSVLVSLSPDLGGATEQEIITPVIAAVVANDGTEGCVPTGIDAPEQPEKINIYPNPTSGPVTIQFPKTFTGTVEVLSVDSKIVLSYPVNNANDLHLTINHLPSGLYIFNLKNESGLFTQQRVIKQ